MTQKTISKFVGLAPRKERRKSAKEKGQPFEPQYNGYEPERVQHKAALKNQINEEKYKEKKKNRNK